MRLDAIRRGVCSAGWMTNLKRQIETKPLLRFVRDAVKPVGLGIALGIIIFLAAASQSRSPEASSQLRAGHTPEAAAAPGTPLRVVRERTEPVRTLPFRTCSAARAEGAAPILRGQPGYGVHLDRDDDGVACEPYLR